MEQFVNNVPVELKDSDQLGAWILPISADVAVAVGRYELNILNMLVLA